VQEIRTAARLDALGADRLAEAGDVDLEGFLGGRRRVAGPEPVDEAFARHRFVAVNDQDGEQRPLLRRAELELFAGFDDRERAEDPEFHQRLLPRGARP
jgi:hypothetical protein